MNLDKISTTNIVVVGDMCLDVNHIGKLGSRRSVEAPALPIFDSSEIVISPGGAANVAMCIAGLGAHSIPIISGRGLHYKSLVEAMCKHESGRIHPYTNDSAPEIKVFTKTIDRDTGAVYSRTDYVTPGDPSYIGVSNKIWRSIRVITGEHYLDKPEGGINFGVIHADYNEHEDNRAMIKNLNYLIEREENIQTFFTSRSGLTHYQYGPSSTNYVVLSLDEANSYDMYDISEVCSKYSIRGGIAITNGQYGVVGYNKTDGFIEIRTVLLEEPMNTCGCGDMFLAAFATLIVSGCDFRTALEYSNAAARVVGRIMNRTGYCGIVDVLREKCYIDEKLGSG